MKPKTYTKEQFLKDVAKEARALKKMLTPDEINKLDAASLNPRSYNKCIYGQMTGDCRSVRASELIFNACQRFCHQPNGDLVGAGWDEKGGSFSNLKKNINGKNIDGVNNHTDLRLKREYEIEFYSSLEAYIMLPKSKKANLIAFLRGERKDLVL